MKSRIFALLAKGEVERALEILLDFYHDKNQNPNLILQSSRYHTAKKAYLDEVITWEQFTSSVNKIILRLIDITNGIEDDESNQIDVRPTKRYLSSLRHLAVAASFLLLLTIGSYWNQESSYENINLAEQIYNPNLGDNHISDRILTLA